MVGIRKFLFLILVTGISGISLAGSGTAGQPPDGLTIEFLHGRKVAGIADKTPEFGWVAHSSHVNDVQAAYHILVASRSDYLNEGKADMWDSDRVASDSSINVEYRGKTLSQGKSYFWKVKTWLRHAGESPWSEAQEFSTATDMGKYLTTRYPLSQTQIAPLSLVNKSDGHYIIDFGKASFGYLKLDINSPKSGLALEVHFGERGDDNGVNRNPGGSLRYYKVIGTLQKGPYSYSIHPPPDAQNTNVKAIKMPPEIGVVAPFRYVELVNCPDALDKSMVRQVAVHYPFNENASSFKSSDGLLNEIWELCKHTIKATSFAGVYVDGDRERIPYEADAYIAQLSHYAVDSEYSLARFSHEYLLKNPTWPTEWKFHSVFMAWTDYMYTGNKESLAQNYEILKSEKTLENRAREDGLINTKGLRDIVDWPEGERDNFEFREVNTVVNAFYYRALVDMADIVEALGKKSDAALYRGKAIKLKAAFNRKLFDSARGVYLDGEGSSHASLHANMMPLAFGLVPQYRLKSVSDFVVSRGMACSPYGAQYLLEALYQAGRPDAALSLMTKKDNRSWHNMLRLGATMTTEAWDFIYKPNLDWSHAWGTAPANIISRYLMGVRPLEPGFKRVLIQPQPASIASASAIVPTIRGAIHVSFENDPKKTFMLKITIPANMTARVGIPCGGDCPPRLLFDGKEVKGRVIGGYIFVDNIGSGQHILKK